VGEHQLLSGGAALLARGVGRRLRAQVGHGRADLARGAAAGAGRLAHAVVVEAGEPVTRAGPVGVALVEGAAQARGEDADGLAELAPDRARARPGTGRVLVGAEVALLVADLRGAAVGRGVALPRDLRALRRVLRLVADPAVAAVLVLALLVGL